jgi:hypothetical protein
MFYPKIALKPQIAYPKPNINFISERFQNHWPPTLATEPILTLATFQLFISGQRQFNPLPRQ